MESTEKIISSHSPVPFDADQMEKIIEIAKNAKGTPINSAEIKHC
jgi:hypothetical protein